MFTKRTNEYLNAVYDKYGYLKMCKVARMMLVSKKHKDDIEFRNQVHGEVCESVLQCGIKEFMSKHPKETCDWRLEKGLILKDPENKLSEFKTEVDITLFTPFKILTFECKCYSGNKTLVDKCTVVRKSVKPYDVYKQHKIHYTVLFSNFRKFRIDDEKLQKYSPIQIAFFDFSLGTLEDKREPRWQNLMPAVGYDTLEDLLNSYLDKPVCWKMPYVHKALTVINKHKEVFRKEHLEYVKQLHKK